MALVSRHHQGDLQGGCWYLVELDGGVFAGRFLKNYGGEFAFRLTPADKGLTCIKPTLVKGISEVVMITMGCY
jgi:hypothetical protein